MESRTAPKRGAEDVAENDEKRQKLTDTPTDPDGINPQALIVVDPDGDLIVCAGEDTGAPRRFRVCSAAMRRSARFFKVLLFGNFAERKPDDDDDDGHGKEWLVSLPEDSPDALHILLQIIHAQPASIPTSPDMSTLCQILVLVDKYGLFDILGPWAPLWMKAAAARVADALADIPTLVEVNWIAYFMGNYDLFNSTGNEIAAKASLNRESDALCDEAGMLLSTGYEFPVEDMLARRREFLQEYLDFLYGCLEFDNDISCRVDPAGLRDNGLRCTTLTLGEMCQKMLETGDFIPRYSADILSPLKILVDRIKQTVNVEGSFHGKRCTFAKSFLDFDTDFKQTYKTRKLATDRDRKQMETHCKRYRLEKTMAELRP